jgi:hypothetical protein
MHFNTPADVQNPCHWRKRYHFDVILLNIWTMKESWNVMATNNSTELFLAVWFRNISRPKLHKTI